MSELSLEDKLCKNLENSCNKAYEAGQQSMQAEIDQLKEALEIKEQLNEALLVADKEKDKRIDEALTEIDHYWKTGATDCIESAEQAMRGVDDINLPR